MPFDPNWIEQGKKLKATHIIVVCDTFDYDDYPVFVRNHAQLASIKKLYASKDMQRIMEIIDIRRLDDANASKRATSRTRSIH